MTFEQQLIKDILSNKVVKNVYEYIEGNKEELQKDPDLYRQYFLNDPKMAYLYAKYVDKCPRDDTRKAACGDPWWAYKYALYVDKCPRDDTRKASCGAPWWAYMYALYVDKCPRDDTFKAVQGSEYEDEYVEDLGKPDKFWKKEGDRYV